jgi:phage tail-like protein
MANLIDRVRVRAGRASWERQKRENPTGYRRDPFVAYAFSVVISDLGTDFNLPKNPDPNRLGFSKISGIGSSITTENVVQGSDPIQIAVPRGIEYETAVFERGITHMPSAYALLQWFDDCKALVAGQPNPKVANRYQPKSTGSEIPFFLKKRNIHIEIPAYPQSFNAQQISPRKRALVGQTYKFSGPAPRNAYAGRIGIKAGPGLKIHLFRAWPVKVEYGDLDANSNEVWVVRMEIKYEGLKIEGIPK